MMSSRVPSRRGELEKFDGDGVIFASCALTASIGSGSGRGPRSRSISMSMSVLAGAVPFVACSATSMMENLGCRESK